jgi:hypothetical protein
VRWTRPGAIHLWAFDLLAVNGRDLRPQPLVKRQARLQALLERFGCPAVRPSETFMDGLALLRVVEQRGLEGAKWEFPPKPSRMRWRTYMGLKRQYDELRGRWMAGVMGRFGVR